MHSQCHCIFNFVPCSWKKKSDQRLRRFKREFYKGKNMNSRLVGLMSITMIFEIIAGSSVLNNFLKYWKVKLKVQNIKKNYFLNFDMSCDLNADCQQYIYLVAWKKNCHSLIYSVHYTFIPQCRWILQSEDGWYIFLEQSV